MADGERDAFIENDVIGNYNTGTSFLGGLSSGKRRKKTKVSRKRGIRRRTRRTKRHKSKGTRGHRKAIGGIKYTKNGQPYKILANGRARFIKGRRRK
jgi:hypothetical protein